MHCVQSEVSFSELDCMYRLIVQVCQGLNLRCWTSAGSLPKGSALLVMAIVSSQ